METIEFSPDMPASQVVESDAMSIHFPHMPKRYYRHGWQSWSLAAWTDTTRLIPVQRPHLLHPMQHDPLYAFQPGHHGSWVGAVETEPGRVLLLGALGLDAHVALEGRDLLGTYDSGSGPWLVAYGDELDAFASYARELGNRLGNVALTPAPRVWCSWYSLYTAIDERILSDVYNELRDLPFDVLQVDDGWQQSIGDWEPNPKFAGGMRALADRIKSTGRRAGLWLAPLIAARSSRLFREHPAWFLHDRRGKLVSAGFNWGQDLQALDTTHPEAREWLASLMRQVRAWGFDYMKLDFLYGGALPGVRHDDIPREAAYRDGLKLMREAMGADAFFVACGAPIIPSIGLCDALRVGPDVSAQWENQRDGVLLHNPSVPGTRNAIRTTMHRLWLSPLVHPDPDVAYFRSVDCQLSPEQKYLLRCLALICGFRATSDPPQWLTPAERDDLQDFLTTSPRIEHPGPRQFTIEGRPLDYSSAMDLARTPAGWAILESAAVGWLANQRWALRLNHQLGERALKRRLASLSSGLSIRPREKGKKSGK